MLLRYLIVLIFLLTGIHVMAQVDSVRQLKEIVIQSNRIQPGFNELSASVTVVSLQDIRKAPAMSLSDVLHYYAGVDIRQRGANGIQADAGIRGSTFDQVLILINGIKVSDPQTGHHSLNLPVDISNVERIEVLKGPAARVFGQNAFAGAINIITRIPEENFLKVQAMAGDFGLGGGRFSASIKEKKAAHFFSAGRDFSQGYRFNTDYVMSNFFYQSQFDSRKGKWSLLGAFTDRAFGANGFYATPSATDQYEAVQTSVASIGYQTKRTQSWAVNHRLYWRRNQDLYLFVRDNPPAYRNFHLNNVVGYELNATNNNKLGVTGIGLDVNSVWIRSNNLGDRQRRVATLFAEHRLLFLKERMDITPGVQLNYYSDFGLNAFPGLDAGLKINDNLKAFGNWGYTYRVPSYTNLYYKDPANLGNPDLKPEYAISYEAGLKLVNVPWMNAQASYFTRKGNRIIDYVKQQSSDPWQVENLLKINMQGLDANVSFTPGEKSKGLTKITLGYTYISADKIQEVSFSKYALDNLKHQVTANVIFQYTNRLYHSINFRYSDRVNLPDYSVVDSRIGWQNREWSFFADVTNIFDKNYTETNLVTMPGRWFKAGFSYTLFPNH